MADSAGKFGLLLLTVLFLYSCGTEYNPEVAKNEVGTNEPVPPDATLETVTWNLEWYGEGAGSDKTQKTANILKVVDSLRSDLYAFQEVADQQILDDLSSNMNGYKGFVADYIDYNQKVAFVYNTNTIDSLAAGPITNGQDEHAWASGRFPLYFNFTYTYQNTTTEIYAIVIHAKAFSDEDSYERRKAAAQDLYDYLMQQKPNANVILLGDYNDDVDESIYEGMETPYHLFVENNTFQVVTSVLSEAGRSSTVDYSDMIDHITMSDELFSSYVDKSAAVFTISSRFIQDYEETTSDHYPVWAKFEMTNE